VTLTRALVVATTLLVPSTTAAAPVVTAAVIRIVVSSPTTCEVTMALRIEGASDVEHRIEAFDGSQIDLDEVSGAQPLGEARPIGRTRSLLLRLGQPEYQIRYRARQGAARRDRCPLWLPAVPTTGLLDAVRLEVHLPAGSRPSSSMPAFTWTGVTGTATLGHVPAFVRVPFAAAGEAAAWDLLRVMDGIAVTMLVGASSIWLWRRRRRAWV
jgi:hypothetical protein